MATSAVLLRSIAAIQILYVNGKYLPNPFKPGEFMDRPAKPASKKIKVLPLKNLKSMV